MTHWLDKVITLIDAETNDLRELAMIAGFNPRTFYLGTILNDVDLQGQNLQGMRFTPRSLQNAIVDSKTKFDSSTIIPDAIPRSQALEDVLTFAHHLVEAQDWLAAIQYLREHAEGFKERMDFKELMGDAFLGANLFNEAALTFGELKNRIARHRSSYFRYSLKLILAYLGMNDERSACALIADFSILDSPVEFSRLIDLVSQRPNAIDIFHRLLSLDSLSNFAPHLALLLDRLTASLFKMRRFDEALKLLEAHADVLLHTHIRSLTIRYGKLLIEVGRTADAVEWLRGASVRDAAGSGIAVNLARALHSDRRTDEAISVLRYTISVRADDVGLWNVLGKLLVDAGKPAEAAEVFREADRRFQGVGIRRRYKTLARALPSP